MSSIAKKDLDFRGRIGLIPCSKLQGIFTERNSIYFLIRSLTPQQAAGNALAAAVQVK
jgi:hypothetical protein